MTSHAPTIDFGNHPPLPNQHFSSWLRGQTALFISQISAILGFILFIASEGRLLCESIPFRSEEEAHDLITESINKVPYCKYSRT